MQRDGQTLTFPAEGAEVGGGQGKVLPAQPLEATSQRSQMPLWVSLTSSGVMGFCGISCLCFSSEAAADLQLPFCEISCHVLAFLAASLK